MKKILSTLFSVALLVIVPYCFGAAITCTETAKLIGRGPATELVLECTGDADTTVTISESNNATYVKGFYLVEVITYPTSGGTAPTDATDFTLLMDGMDILGGKGTNMIDATTTKHTFPYSADTDMYYSPIIDGTLSMAIANQVVSGADFTIKLKFLPLSQ